MKTYLTDTILYNPRILVVTYDSSEVIYIDLFKKQVCTTKLLTDSLDDTYFYVGRNTFYIKHLFKVDYKGKVIDTTYIC